MRRSRASCRGDNRSPYVTCGCSADLRRSHGQASSFHRHELLRARTFYCDPSTGGWPFNLPTGTTFSKPVEHNRHICFWGGLSQEWPHMLLCRRNGLLSSEDVHPKNYHLAPTPQNLSSGSPVNYFSSTHLNSNVCRSPSLRRRSASTCPGGKL